MTFEIVGEIVAIAISGAIRELNRLRRSYGRGRWRKCEGLAIVRLHDGSVQKAEVHWHEASGVGRVELKIKRFLD